MSVPSEEYRCNILLGNSIITCDFKRELKSTSSINFREYNS